MPFFFVPAARRLGAAQTRRREPFLLLFLSSSLLGARPRGGPAARPSAPVGAREACDGAPMPSSAARGRYMIPGEQNSDWIPDMAGGGT